MNTSYFAEMAVLGSLIKQPDLIDEYYLQAEEFDDERHRLIAEYLRYSFDQDGTADLQKMIERSGKNLMKIGGMGYLLELRDSVPTTALFHQYQEEIRSNYIRRKTSSTLYDVVLSGERDGIDVQEYLAKAKAAIEEIEELQSPQESEIKKLSDVLQDHDKVLIKRSQQQGITGAPTASKDLDRLTGGHQDGDLEVIAARPSIGKTAYVVNDMLATARGGRTAILFSLEMPELRIAERFLCSIGNIDNKKLRSGNMSDQDWERWSYAMDELHRLPIYIDETPGMTFQDISRKVKKMKKLHPNLVVYIDFLQLVGTQQRFNKDHERVAYVSKGLKQLARRFKCPVVAISAVGRKCEERQDKRPMLSDLRESGSIESDADIIIFLYRDDYYNPDSSKKGIIEIIVAKGRDVGTGTIEMVFNRKTGRFVNIDRSKDEEK